MPDEPAQSPFWPADNAAVTAHIGLLQDIISRMANNSASCKTWCLALVGALLGLAGAVHSPAVVAFAVVAVVVFGFVDTMYLAQEKAYRDLYDSTVKAIRDGTYGRNNLFEARAQRTLRDVAWALASWSIWPIYLTLILAYLVARCTGLIAALTAVSKTS
jgi:hypothetical protein